MAGRWVGSSATAALLAVFVVALALPVPELSIAMKVARLMVRRTPGTIVISGNSVLSHTSRCDADRSTLTELLDRRLAGRLLDVGHAGQMFGEALNFLALGLRQANVETVVLTLGAYQLSERSWPALQTQLFMRAGASASFALNSLSARLADGFMLSGGAPETEAFSYRDVAYPDYPEMKGYFAREKAAMTCPETLGVQREFIEAYYWYEYVSRKDVDSHYEDLGRLAQLSRSVGKRLLVVLLPASHQDAAALNPAVGAAMARHMDAIAQRIRADGIELLDLMRAPSVDYFVDRWCACGHLSALGRNWVSAELAERLLAGR